MLTGVGIEHQLSAAGHLQTDGQTECINQMIKEYLLSYIGHLQDDWYSLLPLTKFTYNNSYNTAIKTTPFYRTMASTPSSQCIRQQPTP